MRVFTPLVNKDCSANLQFFLCVLYVPPCVINMDDIIPPCREVCEEVRRGCEPDMITAGYPWPPFMDCKQFPLHDKKGFCLKPKSKCQKSKYQFFPLIPYIFIWFYLIRFTYQMFHWSLVDVMQVLWQITLRKLAHLQAGFRVLGRAWKLQSRERNTRDERVSFESTSLVPQRLSVVNSLSRQREKLDGSAWIEVLE